MLERFIISKCDLVEIILENIRFLSHITLLHILNCTLNDSEELFDVRYLKIMLFTALAIVIYNILVKKLFESKTKKLKYVCMGKPKDEQ